MDIATDFFHSLNQMWEKISGMDKAIEVLENIISSIIELLTFMFTTFWLNVVPQFMSLIRLFVFLIQNLVLVVVLLEIYFIAKCVYDHKDPISMLSEFFDLNLKLVNYIFVKMLSMITFVIGLFRAVIPTK